MPIKKFLKSAQAIKDQAQVRRQDAPKAKAADDEGNWLVSYADMMTLLCGFFIMLFSMAKMDEPQFEKVKEAMSEQFGGEYKNPTKELAQVVTQAIQDAGIEAEAIVTRNHQGVSLSFESTVFFETLSADVKPQGRKVLDQLIAKIKEHQTQHSKQYKVVIEGHTDGRPVVAGVYPSNWELSGARASRVVRLFMDHSFSPDHLTAIGYADTHPKVPARTPSGAWDEEALAKNRRVVLRVLEPGVDAIPYPDAPGVTEGGRAQASAPTQASTSAQAPASAPGPASARTPASAQPHVPPAVPAPLQAPAPAQNPAVAPPAAPAAH